MYHTTGLDKAEILDLCEMIHREAVPDERTWPPILGLYKSVVVTLTYVRRNRVQAEIAEAFEVSQSTISRAVSALTGLVGRVLRRYVPTADELDDRTQYVVDGTLLPCWSWAGHPELYSGKHTAPRRRPAVYPTQSGGIGGIIPGSDA
jgi:Helix-turn-helix of DDE superfamily endonuclease